ncbi:transposase [Bathymodiolus septemdierum thioautotrophic gill symbiont]|nr:transposase [Bathymodiolus septemdierum thioautotrophic gill symbiont]
MAQRQTIILTDNYYHVFNRGIDRRVIFQDREDLKYFLDRMHDFNNTESFGGVYHQNLPCNQKLISPAYKLVSIVAYCLLPNHFHLILKPQVENGVAKFMQRLCTGYVKFFNKKYQRSGALFQGRFKANQIEGYEALSFLSVYVNLNYRHHRIDPQKNLVSSSFSSYLGVNDNILDIEEVNQIIDSMNSYEEYAYLQSDYFTQNKDYTKNINDDL